MEDRTGLKVVVEDPTAASGTRTKDFQEQVSLPLPMWDLTGAPDLSSAATSASTTLPLQVGPLLLLHQDSISTSTQQQTLYISTTTYFSGKFYVRLQNSGNSKTCSRSPNMM